MGTSTLPTPLPSTCSIRLFDGLSYYRTGEFIRFSICSTRAGTLPSCAASIASDLESGDSIVVLLLNFGGILQQKTMSHHGVCTTKKKKRKMYRCSTKMCPIGRMLDFGLEHTKAQKLV